MSIILATLNARYSHASLGLRYLLANMGDLQAETEIQEFVIGSGVTRIAELLLARQPRIIGLAVYIWNIEDSTRLVAILKRVAPQITIILGGPEVSYESSEQAIVADADYVITGWGEVTLPKLCRQILAGAPPPAKIHAGEQAPLDSLTLPYACYSDKDIAHRTLYVEASRGCPFKCEFCLSALDKTAWPFPLDAFLTELESLYQRGARLFKFVDRTFNLNVKASLRILDFFLTKLAAHPDDPVFAHFEVVPDHLPAALKDAIRQFPPGSLQLEIGVQTFNPTVQALVSRKQDNAQAAANIRWLVEESHAHLHVDLIAGLPGEDMNSFGAGFDQLYALGPHEIQFGILKRLRGTPIIRHTAGYGLIFDPQPPYTILATDCLPFADLQRLTRFARYWDMVANSGRFANTLPALLGDHPFANFLALSDWLYAQTGATHNIALDRLAHLLGNWLQRQGMTAAASAALIGGDYGGQPQHRQSKQEKADDAAALRRQARHLAQ